jgi:hypothetical protein
MRVRRIVNHLSLGESENDSRRFSRIALANASFFRIVATYATLLGKFLSCSYVRYRAILFRNLDRLSLNYTLRIAPIARAFSVSLRCTLDLPTVSSA